MEAWRNVCVPKQVNTMAEVQPIAPKKGCYLMSENLSKVYMVT